MKKYSTILFDLDGTLTNPESGLVSGFVYAFGKLGIDYGERESLKRFIGPPLHAEWQKEFGFTPEESSEAIRLLREYYDVYGWWDNEVYPGISELLRALSEDGKILAVATSKPEKTAKRVLSLFGLDKYFAFIGGASGSETRDKKEEVIEYVLDNLGINDKSECVLVGDRIYDAIGARAVGIDSIGILWGHGTEEEIRRAGFSLAVSTPSELYRVL
ncbi:MAG: HAD-IA family hydrolase [Clostridia bacterium]|nr:HAD-IA family hydrolase [Clostridia bacterium]